MFVRDAAPEESQTSTRHWDILVLLYRKSWSNAVFRSLLQSVMLLCKIGVIRHVLFSMGSWAEVSS